jgi:sterol desaturase/sphingolipid hydroxylase (fatty acid hydroxylase superfamily)
MRDVLLASDPLVLGAWVLLFMVVLSAGSTALGFAAERAFPTRRIFQVALWPGQLRFELLGNLIFISVATLAFTAALAGGVVRFSEETLLAGALTFLALMMGFQLFYWLLHRAMHTKVLVRFHAWHHRSHVTTPLSGQSMSLVESCLWMAGYVGLPWLFSLWLPISFWGWAAYIAFNVSGNVFGHSNVELGASVKAAPFANPFVFHALHHARWRGHYGFQAALMDRLFGTEFSDWPALFERVSSGHPLESLKETQR